MDIETRLTRLEIVFEHGAPAGAQATVEEGFAQEGGRWVKINERTFGLDTERNPEYAMTLESAVGSAAAQILAANRNLERELARLEERIHVLEADCASLAAERDRLAGQPAEDPRQ
jgi:hypothetical protein